MARPKSYVDLIVWQKAMAVARKIYKVSEQRQNSANPASSANSAKL